MKNSQSHSSLIEETQILNRMCLLGLDNVQIGRKKRIASENFHH